MSETAAATAFLLILAASPVAVLVLHALLSRVLRRLAPGVPTRLVPVLAVAAGAPGLALLVPRLFPAGAEHARAWAAAYGFVVYACLSYCYFHLFSMSESARRIRILYVLFEGGRIPRAEFSSRYGVKDMVFNRLDRLETIGQVERRDGRYFAKGGSVGLIGKVLIGWGKVLGFQPGSMSL
jgi:hypothetical protein